MTDDGVMTGTHERRPVCFRALEEHDLPTVSEWLRADHVRRWWRDAADLDAVQAKYRPRMSGNEPTEVFVVSVGDEPVGLIQRYRFADYGAWAATVADTEIVFPAAAGIDYLIGVVEQTRGGLGARLLEEYNDVDTIVVTPQHANQASRRVLEKSGYSLAWIGRLESADSEDSAIYVKHRRRPDSAT